MAFNTSIISRLTLLVFIVIFLSGMASPPLRVGGPAPTFELKTRKGKVFKSSDLKNKMVILNFWATWCVPCTKEMPELNKAYSSLKDNDVEIIAINFAETRSKVDEFVNKHHLKFPVLLDKYGDVSQDYRVRNLPVTYFISRDGIIVDSVFGGITQKLIEIKLKQLDQATQTQE
jgi:peroxiredoxin